MSRYITTPSGLTFKVCARCGNQTPKDSDYCRPCLRLELGGKKTVHPNSTAAKKWGRTAWTKSRRA